MALREWSLIAGTNLNRRKVSQGHDDPKEVDIPCGGRSPSGTRGFKERVRCEIKKKRVGAIEPQNDNEIIYS